MRIQFKISELIGSSRALKSVLLAIRIWPFETAFTVQLVSLLLCPP